MVATSLVFAVFVALAYGKPVVRNMIVHESIAAPPPGFAKVAAAAPTDTVNVRLGLKSTNIGGLQAKLLAVSTPGSPLYGQHLSQAEVEEFTAPTPETVKAVNSWLSEHGISAETISHAGDWVKFSVPVAKANELFDADYSVFEHSATGSQAVRSLTVSVPANLHDAIDVVHPGTSFWNPNGLKPSVSLAGGRVKSVSGVTPAVVQSLYGVPSTPATQSSNSIAVAGFVGQFAQQADLTSFLKQFRTDVNSNTAFKTQTLDGGSNPQSLSDAGDEANLDIQYTVGIATGVPVTFVSVGDNFQDGDLEGFLDIVNFLSKESPPPQVFTTSYGQNENTISASLATKLCNAYAALGAQGTSILFASGDGGVSGSQSGSCSTFVPTFPSGCPFLTSVGATQGTTSETAADFSAGGFSNYFSVAVFQTDAVAAYKKALGSTNKGKFNNTGRGYPDVAAAGTDVNIISGGRGEAVDGTSCASPIFASVIALINDRLIAAGSSPLGFLNPFLYANPDAFNDITSGSNPGCNTNGFPAKTGWDPVTGLGSPNFNALLQAAQAAAGNAGGSSGDPGSGDPGSGDPGSGNPGSGDPGSGDPGSSDPGSGGPGSGDLGSGDLGSGDPGNGNPFCTWFPFFC